MFWSVLNSLILLAVAFKIYMKLTIGICKSKNRMDGKTVLITGANTGVGKTTALELAKRGAKVILACRDLHKAKQAMDDIISETGNENVSIVKLDLASLTSVRECAREVLASESRLDVLINNAGMITFNGIVTSDGLPSIMQVNHYGPFLLTNLLLELVKKSSPSRIIFVSSNANYLAKFNRDTFDTNPCWLYPFQHYAASKVFNILAANALAEKLRGTGVTVNSLHPGGVDTEISRSTPFILPRIFYKTVEIVFLKSKFEGAQTSIYLAVADEVASVTGKYFHDCKDTKPNPIVHDKELAKKLWRISEERVGLTSA